MRPAACRLIRSLAPVVALLLSSPLLAAEFNMNVTAAGIRPGAHVAGPMLSPESITNRVVLLEFWGLNCPDPLPKS